MAQQVNGIAEHLEYRVPGHTNGINVTLYLGTDIINMTIPSKIVIYYQVQCFSFSTRRRKQSLILILGIDPS